MILKIIEIIFGIILLNAVTSIVSNQIWDFDLVSIDFLTEDPDIVDGQLNVKRISRTERVLSGEVHVKYDIYEDDSNEMTITVQRSPDGSEHNYKLLPVGVARQHVTKFLNTYYKDLGFMESFQNCSNVLTFKDQVQTPIRAQKYTFDNCGVMPNGLPSHVMSGYYKIHGIIYGPAKWEIILITNVYNN